METRKYSKILEFSSIFCCDTNAVSDHYYSACEKLNIVDYRKKHNVKELYIHLVANSRAYSKGPNYSKVLEVPSDGNCLFYCLLAPLLGYIPEIVGIYLII